MKIVPIVSVVVPTKNSARTLKRCLESIRSQKHAKIEIIVVDNFSTDTTPEIANQLADKVFSKGPERCTQRNYGVSKSTGEYVAIIDSDMYLKPSAIGEAVKKLQNKETAGVVIPEESIGKGFWAKCKIFERSYYTDQSFMQAARVFRKSDYQKVGGYDESLISGEDWDLSQRIANHGDIVVANSLIEHDEGTISLLTTIRKKYYYSKHFSRYLSKNRGNPIVKDQTNALKRYALFFSKPKKILSNPLVFFGMLFMKTMEFTFGGMGLLVGKIQN